jgi:hypothetical protein
MERMHLRTIGVVPEEVVIVPDAMHGAGRHRADERGELLLCHELAVEHEEVLRELEVRHRLGVRGACDIQVERVAEQHEVIGIAGCNPRPDGLRCKHPVRHA